MDNVSAVLDGFEPIKPVKEKHAPEVQALSIEHFILHSVQVLKEKAYGSEVAIHASEASEKRIADGAFYGAVNHLRSKGLIKTTKKGVRSIHSITEEGLLALQIAETKILNSQQFFCTG